MAEKGRKFRSCRSALHVADSKIGPNTEVRVSKRKGEWEVFTLYESNTTKP